MEQIKLVDIKNYGMKVGEIFSTYDYDMFKPTEDNRILLDEEPTDTNYRRLKEQIKEFGTNYNPIICNEYGDKLKIVSGHHRFIACKYTNSPITYTINNNYTFDMSIAETKATSNWTNGDKFSRGLRNNVPICLEVQRITNNYEMIRDTETGRRVAFDGFKRVARLSSNKTTRMLETSEGIEHLKNITFTADELDFVETYVSRYVEVLLITKRYATDRYRGMTVRICSQEAFNSMYDTLEEIWNVFIKNLVKLCKEKNKNSCSEKRLRIYTKLIDSSSNSIKEAFKEIICL